MVPNPTGHGTGVRVGGHGHDDSGRYGMCGRGGHSGRLRAGVGESEHPAGRAHYSISELEHTLESVYCYLPISGAMWDLVADCHS